MERAPHRAIAPFALSAAIILLDQATKALVQARVNPGSIAWSAFGDFFWLVRQQNLGMAFSLLDNLPPYLRLPILILLPLGLVAFVLVYYFKSDEVTPFQRWALCGIVGGGLGNVIDRIFRPEGVVDFLSFKFYGLFGMERWPTFNVADASVVVSVILLSASVIAAEAKAAT
ncbi:MAG TPA: signal peptidase II [Spirochaetales bacterium]|nr:signal peptidase II [Spirochaetales bacterium]HRY53350.1 signal peptidase II [Spirochaetia bacterium]